MGYNGVVGFNLGETPTVCVTHTHTATWALGVHNSTMSYIPCVNDTLSIQAALVAGIICMA